MWLTSTNVLHLTLTVYKTSMVNKQMIAWKISKSQTHKRNLKQHCKTINWCSREECCLCLQLISKQKNKIKILAWKLRLAFSAHNKSMLFSTWRLKVLSTILFQILQQSLMLSQKTVGFLSLWERAPLVGIWMFLLGLKLKVWLNCLKWSS